MKQINIAITSIGSGVGQSVIDSCRLSNLPIKTFGYGNNPFAFGSYSCDVQRPLTTIYDDFYLKELLELCRSDQIDVLIPGLDDELILLAEHLQDFRKHDIHVPVSSLYVISLCRDKDRMSKVLNQYGNFFVKSFKKSQLNNEINTDCLSFPLIAKPISGFASRGIMVLQNKSDLDYVSDTHVIQEIAAPNQNDPHYKSFTHSLSKGQILQIGEISLQILVAKNGRELGRYASYNKLHNGIPVEITPSDVPSAWDAVDSFLPVLKKSGIYGPLNIQGRITDEGPKFFEMNARFTGITGLRALTGFNEVEAIILDAINDGKTFSALQQNTRKIGLRQVTNKVVDFTSNRELENITESYGIRFESRLGRKALVTGANSYLGRAVLRELLRHSDIDEIFAVVRNTERFKNHQEPPLPDGITIVDTDELYNGIFQLGAVDVICHIASARPTHNNLEIANSLQFTNFITNAAIKFQTPGFINISSQSVYGTKRDPLWNESTPVAPETPYAQSKWASELMTNNIKTFNTHCATSSLRIGRLIGPSTVIRETELAHKFLNAAFKGETLQVWGGEQKLDFIDVRDAAEIIALICSYPYSNWPRLLNVSGGKPISVIDLANMCINIAEKNGIITAGIEIIPDIQASNFGMDIELAAREIGWVPKYSIEQTLRDLEKS